MISRSHKVFIYSDSHYQREILDKKTSVDLEDHKASDSDLNLEYHKASDLDSNLKDHKVSDSYSNISIFCYEFRYASANPVF